MIEDSRYGSTHNSDHQIINNKYIRRGLSVALPNASTMDP